MKKSTKTIIDEPRINDEINTNGDVRIIYTPKDGDGFNKVMSLDEARRVAEKYELDLIEINGKINPIILRLDDYSKYLYELKKKKKEQKKPQQQLKEIQLSASISSHDMEVKANKAREFLNNGDKVKVVLTLRGRELAHRETNKKSIYSFIVLLNDISVPENMPKDEGNRTILILKHK